MILFYPSTTNRFMCIPREYATNAYMTIRDDSTNVSVDYTLVPRIDGVGNIYIENDSLSFNNPIKYTKRNTLISGYISKENYKSIKDSRPFVNFKIKKGNINIFSDNTNFRGFWYGTNKLMMNAIFFSNIM